MHIDRDIEIFRKYEKLYNYIENNLYADLSVAEVCRQLGFSQTYIGQQFKSDTGKTIKQHIPIELIKMEHGQVEKAIKHQQY